MYPPTDITIDFGTSASTSSLRLIRRSVGALLRSIWFDDVPIDPDAVVDVRFALDSICGSVVARSVSSEPLDCRVEVDRNSVSWTVCARLAGGAIGITDDVGWRMATILLDEIRVVDDDPAHFEVFCCKELVA